MDNWQYLVLRPAQRYLERMPPPDQRRVIKALDTLLANPEVLDIKPLKGRPEKRLRIGKYRVLFIEDPENRAYIVTLIRPRGDVYK